MNIHEIAKMPTSVGPEHFTGPNPPIAVHESMVRSYQILAKAKEWLANGTPGSTVLEMIEAIESAGDYYEAKAGE